MISALRKRSDYIPAVLVTAGVIVLSLWENPYMPSSVQVGDKTLHGLMYAVLAASWAFPVYRRAHTHVISCLYIWVACTVFGALMEMLQRFCTLTRSGEMADLYADAIGALAGAVLMSFIGTQKPKGNNH